jgi:thiol-disulfide isomerase/thioredoxin
VLLSRSWPIRSQGASRLSDAAARVTGLLALLIGGIRSMPHASSSSQRSQKRCPACVPIIALALTVSQLGSPANYAMAEPAADQQAPGQDKAAAETAGIGVALGESDGGFLVQAIVPDSPAEKSRGVNIGDRIVAVAQAGQEPVSVIGMSLRDVAAMIRGTAGTTVRLTIIPQGQQEDHTVVVSLIRGSVKALNVFGDGILLAPKTIIPNFEYVRLSNLANGQIHDHSGKLLVLEFWASWCGPCLQTLDKTEAILEKHPEWVDKVEIVAVGVDEVRTNAVKCLENRKWKRLTTVWTGEEVLKPYHVASLPVIYFVGPDRRIVEANQQTDLETTLRTLLTQPVDGLPSNKPDR